MHLTRIFWAVSFYISLTFALESSSLSLRSLLRQRSQERINLQHLNARAIPTGWSSVGCVTDGAARALSYSYTSTTLTQEACISTCSTKGYIYAGLQYADECWCGNSLANNLGVPTAASQCNMPCKGNANQICGAGYRLTLFKKAPSVQSTTIKTTSIPQTTAVQTTAAPTSVWTLTQACAVDTPARILQGYNVASSLNTPSYCQSTCAGKGFSIAGVENGNECWCGNSIIGGTPAVGLASTCSIACAGASTSKCGGGWRMQIYTARVAASTATTPSSTSSTPPANASAPSATPSSWVLSSACVVDTPARILQGYQLISSLITPSYCQSTCAGKGFSIAGVENGNECWCGNSIIGGTPAVGLASTCNIACAGASASNCGGGWRMQLYTAITASATTTRTTTTPTSAATLISATTIPGASSPSTSTAATSTAATSTAATSTTDTNIITGTSSTNTSATIIATITTDTSITNASSTSTTTAVPSPSATFLDAPLAIGWALSRSCVADTPAHALHGYHYTSLTLTPMECQLACAVKELSIAAVENGIDCYCGNVFVGGAPAFANASDCGAACAGDPLIACGGNSTMSVYTSTIASITDMWQTAWDRTTQLTALNLSPIDFTTAGPIADADITVDETATYQTMDGFGASLTDSSAKLLANLKVMNPANYNSLLHQLFDVSDGSYSAMSSVLRLPLGATDFSDTVWSYCDTPGDTTFSTFNISRAPPAVWTVLSDILAINSHIKIYVVPWSPPAWMKDSNNMRGGSISPNYVAIYPTYLLKALQGLRAKGIPLYSIAIQNEPMYSNNFYPSTLVPVDTEATIARALRTLMNNNGFSSVKILGYDHNFSGASTYPVQLLTLNPDSFAGASFHCYGGIVGQIDSFRSAFPAKEIHMTECSGVYGTDWWNDIKWYSDNLFIGGPEHYAKSSMMWNIALDGNGKPMLPGATSCGTPCRGIVQINANGTYSFNQEFWPIAHAGKAIAPKDVGGAFAQRIAVTVGGTFSWALRVSAYVTPRLLPTDKTRYSLVVLNWRDYVTSVPGGNATAQPTTINFRGVQATYTFPVGLTTLSWYA
ncbi:glycoside hydrolase superfamily [Mycena rosella]|uniref:Glycoside hydrolase superfamily n=1 Tax=Mycena rosella TaxID=1033263 RepID=A0AAD7MBN1_MYCRO|nr:glycoside hydrolase superfamily [Mycena rosella]